MAMLVYTRTETGTEVTQVGRYTTRKDGRTRVREVYENVDSILSSIIHIHTDIRLGSDASVV